MSPDERDPGPNEGPQPHWARRTPRENAVALGVLGGFALSIVALAAALLERTGFVELPHVGLAPPGAGALFFAVLLWRNRSRH